MTTPLPPLTPTPALRQVALACALVLAACAAPPQTDQGEDDTSGDTSTRFGSDTLSDAGLADTAGANPDASDALDPDAPDPTDSHLPDAPAADTPAADAPAADITDTASTDTPTSDAGLADATDGGVTPPTPCGQVTFSYTPTPGVKQVLLAGSFNGWAGTADKAEVLLDDDGDGVWTVVVQLEPGTFQYKFVVDGTWIADPNNLDTADDGFGGKNSVLTVDPCPAALALDSVTVDSKLGALDATFSTPAGPLDPKQVSVTLDHAAVSPGAATWGGGALSLKLSGLAKGIHDVRVRVSGGLPSGDDLVLLLKVYVDTSTDWRDAPIYFVMTDRFANGDASNDDLLPGVDKRTNFSGGDFKGALAKLKSGYFTKLGVGALWLSWPVKQPAKAEDGSFPDGTGCGLGPGKVTYSPMKYTGYHGYWPTDTTKTEPRFGTLKELQDLVDAAHAQGIRVLLDYTANHVHTDSGWWQTFKDLGWFHTPAEVCQDVGWDNKPVTCWFTSYLADLNYSNPKTIAASLDSAFWWAKSSGADGFRLDAVKHIEMDFVKALRKRAKAEMELTGVDFYIVGETFTGDAKAIQSFVGPDKIHAQFDFPANMQLLEGFAKQSKGLDAMDATIRGIRGVYTDSGAWMSTFIGNHDMARFISHASGGLPCGVWDIVSNQAAGWKSPPKPPTDQAPYDQLKLAFAYLFTTPGIPLVYYGDEFGLPGAGDPDNRRLMRFGGDLSSKEAATLAWMQQLGALRAQHAALRSGSWSPPLWQEATFLAWGRTTGGDQAVVLLNRAGSEKKGDLTVTPAGVADGTELTEWFTGAKVKVAGGKIPFAVPARTAQVWTTP